MGETPARTDVSLNLKLVMSLGSLVQNLSWLMVCHILLKTSNLPRTNVLLQATLMSHPREFCGRCAFCCGGDGNATTLRIKYLPCKEAPEGNAHPLTTVCWCCDLEIEGSVTENRVSPRKVLPTCRHVNTWQDEHNIIKYYRFRSFHGIPTSMDYLMLIRFSIAGNIFSKIHCW